MALEFRKAFYVKLGPAGKWESGSIANGRLLFGWSGQSIEDINSHAWSKIEKQLRRIS